VDFVSGAMVDLMPGEGEAEALEDTLGLLEDILELFPAVGCVVAS
jgi:hypothetical protein